MITFFQRLYHFDELIRWGGHLALIAIVFAETGFMAGFFLPGDSLLVTAGLLSAAGYLKIWILLGELTLASIAGDSINYLAGRHIGPRIFTKEDSLLFHKNHLMRTEAFYEKYGAKTVFLARFIPILRTFAPAVAGVGRMVYGRFLVFSIAGGISWVFSMVLTGFFLGRTVPHIERHIHEIIGVVIVISFVPIAIEYLKEKKIKAKK